jgi:hypothetical protein
MDAAASPGRAGEADWTIAPAQVVSPFDSFPDVDQPRLGRRPAAARPLKGRASCRTEPRAAGRRGTERALLPGWERVPVTRAARWPFAGLQIAGAGATLYVGPGRPGRRGHRGSLRASVRGRAPLSCQSAHEHDSLHPCWKLPGRSNARGSGSGWVCRPPAWHHRGRAAPIPVYANPVPLRPFVEAGATS